MKLKSKFLILFITFAILPLIISGILVTYESNKFSREDANKQLSSQNTLFKNGMSQTITLIKNTSKSLADNVLVKNYLTNTNKTNEVPEMLKESIKTYKFKENIFLVDSSGKCLLDALDSLQDKDLSDMEYFVNVAKNRKQYIGKIKSSIVTGNPIFIIATPIFSNSHDFIGSIIESIDLSALSQKYIKNIKVGKSGYMYLVDKAGLIIAHPKKEEILTKNFLKLNISKKVLNSKNGIESYEYNGTKKLISYSLDKNTNWIFISTIPISELAQTSYKLLATILLIIILTSLICAFIALIIAKGVSKPILTISDDMSKVAHGDFTISLSDKGKNEIAHMANRINRTMKSLRFSISGVKNTANNIGNSSSTLASTSKQMTNAATEVASAIQEVAEGSTKQANDLVDIVTLLDEFTKDLNNVKYNLNTVTSKTTETQNKSLEGKEQINYLIHSITNIKTTFESAANEVSNLSSTVSKIGNITDIINSISEQTNLLALNASIEAARAGEQGKGFAVVANEVGNLAEQSQNSSKEILQLVKSITVETNDVMNTTKEVKGLLDDQEVTANNTITSFTTIISSIQEVTPLIKGTNTSLNNAIDSKNVVTSKVENVSAVSQEVSASSEEISASSEEMLASSEEVAKLAVNMDTVSNDLVEKVSQFKIN